MKRLAKSSTDKKVAGVCGGLAEYFGIDSTIIRVIWAILIFAAGTGLLAYIIAAIAMPSADAAASRDADYKAGYQDGYTDAVKDNKKDE